MRKRKFKQILKIIAQENHITVDEVRKEIEFAMDEAQKNADPIVRAKWEAIPREGTSLTPEEFVEYITKQIIM